jgi:hypothetical protein
MLAILLGVAALVLVILPVGPQVASARSGTLHATILPRALASLKPAATSQFTRSTQWMLAQDQDKDDTGESTAGKGVSPNEIQKYVAVYRAMQRNHSITVEQAAAAQGLTVGSFRDLERRIESDDVARDDARRALAAPDVGATPIAKPEAQR